MREARRGAAVDVERAEAARGADADGPPARAGSTGEPGGLRDDEAVGVVVEEREVGPAPARARRAARRRATSISSPPKSLRWMEQVFPRMRTLPASTSARARSSESGERARDEAVEPLAASPRGARSSGPFGSSTRAPVGAAATPPLARAAARRNPRTREPW